MAQVFSLDDFIFGITYLHYVDDFRDTHATLDAIFTNADPLDFTDIENTVAFLGAQWSVVSFREAYLSDRIYQYSIKAYPYGFTKWIDKPIKNLTLLATEMGCKLSTGSTSTDFEFVPNNQTAGAILGKMRYLSWEQNINSPSQTQCIRVNNNGLLAKTYESLISAAPRDIATSDDISSITHAYLSDYELSQNSRDFIPHPTRYLHWHDLIIKEKMEFRSNILMTLLSNFSWKPEGQTNISTKTWTLLRQEWTSGNPNQPLIQTFGVLDFAEASTRLFPLGYPSE